MSKILKANCIKVDSDNKIEINIPAFSPKAHDSKVPAAISFDEFAVTDELVEFDSDEEEYTSEEIMENAEAQAQEIIENAKKQAQEIIENAKNQIEAEKAEIYEDARAQGYEAGLLAAEKETQDLKDEAKKVLEQAVIEKEEIIDGIEGEMVDIISLIVQKLTSKGLIINNQIILNLIKQGLAQTNLKGELFIRVSEKDYDAVFENRDDFMKLADGSTSIEITKDFSLDLGDCVIETPFGNIDCSLSRQFEGLKQSLYYILENR